jgi:hypothetical protein
MIPWQEAPAVIWTHRKIDRAEWQTVQDQFESLFTKLGCPEQMMLVATSGDDPGQAFLFASLPNTSLLHALEGFESIGESALPSDASLLIGHNGQFDKYFRYPSRRP